MNMDEITSLIGALDKSSVSVLELKDGEFSLKLEKAAQQIVTTPTVMPVAVTADPESAGEELGPDVKEVLSPMVGTFHTLKDEVKVGDRLKKGDALCSIEAMKLMNEIVMEEDGEIVWVSAGEGDLVEFGQQLFQYRP